LLRLGAPLLALIDTRPLALVVGDHDDTREMMTLYLRSNGIRVLGLPPDNANLAAATSQPFDIIAADVGRSASTVLNFCASVRTYEALAAIPIVAITSHTDERFAIAAKRANCAAVLMKPCAPAVLLAAIYSVLNLTPHVRG